jgi:hypothetical protein
VLDTLTAVWSGNENDTAEMVGFDREVVRPIISATGASLLTLDHTGLPQAFVPRSGVNRPRGSAAKGQKADFLLEFKAETEREFSITHSKNRFGGDKELKRQFRIVDDEDEGTISLELVETSSDAKAREVADAMVAFICAADRPISTKSLRNAMKGTGGKDACTDAMALLKREEPPRVVTGKRTIESDSGRKSSAQAWWPPGDGML